MPTHIAAPIPIAPPPRRQLSLVTSPQDLFASLNATLANKGNTLVTPIHSIQVNDYTVPAPPPPSPVSFRSEVQWPISVRR